MEILDEFLDTVEQEVAEIGSEHGASLAVQRMSLTSGVSKSLIALLQDGDAGKIQQYLLGVLEKVTKQLFPQGDKRVQGLLGILKGKQGSFRQFVLMAEADRYCESG